MSDITSVRGDSLTDCLPLTQACIKALTDKMDDKRKFAANEIEKMTVEFSMSNNLTMVNRLIIVLGRKFCLSHHQNTRKGGLLGLAAVMVGFKNGSILDPPPEMVEEVVRPILTCLLDSDPRVRYYACESLYNVIKVAKSNVLPQFELIFDSLSRLVADPDLSVRAGSETLDKLLKDILTEQSEFDVKRFINRLDDYVYTKNPFTRMFILSWVRLLDSKFDMIGHLPQLLDGVFMCLYDSTEEIRATTLAVLSEFLNKIVVRPTDETNMSSLMVTLLKHARSGKDDNIKYTAISWLKQFIRLMDGSEMLAFGSDILSAILPCLAYQPSDTNYPSASDRNQSYSGSRLYISNSVSQGNICEIATIVNLSLLEQVTIYLNDRRNSEMSNSETIPRDIEAILDILAREILKQDHPTTKLAILDWIKALKKAEPDLIMASASQQKLFQTLMKTLSARSDAVVKNALQVITGVFCADDDPQSYAISNEDNSAPEKEPEASESRRKRSPSRTSATGLARPGTGGKKVDIIPGDSTAASQQPCSSNIDKFIHALCKTFRENEAIFEERGSFIIINLCSMIKPDVVYKSFAEILKDDRTDFKFSYNLVQKLNQILLTTQPLYGLRSRLGNEDDPEMTTLFHALYFAWCHSPIAVITLCLLTNNYRHANEIVVALAQTDINIETLTQIDWIIQLIESPVFAPLRMRLLDVNSNQYLIQSLYGLLMILPQSEAYRKLSHRLDQVHKYMCAQNYNKSIVLPTNPHKQGSTSLASTATGPSTKETRKTNPATSLESLMKHFHAIQNQRAKLNRLGGDFLDDSC